MFLLINGTFCLKAKEIIYLLHCISYTAYSNFLLLDLQIVFVQQNKLTADANVGPSRIHIYEINCIKSCINLCVYFIVAKKL